MPELGKGRGQRFIWLAGCEAAGRKVSGVWTLFSSPSSIFHTTTCQIQYVQGQHHQRGGWGGTVQFAIKFSFTETSDKTSLALSSSASHLTRSYWEEGFSPPNYAKENFFGIGQLHCNSPGLYKWTVKEATSGTKLLSCYRRLEAPSPWLEHPWYSSVLNQVKSNIKYY